MHVSKVVVVVVVFFIIYNTMVRITERQSSIETEPRTLNVHQFQLAREAARIVVNTKTLEEALRIFTQGLEPVVRCEGEDQCRDLVGGGGGEQWCAINDKFGDRDAVSAPF